MSKLALFFWILWTAGGLHALFAAAASIALWLDRRRGKYKSQTRANAKARLRVEAMTVAGQLHLELDSIQLQGLDKVVDSIIDAAKEEFQQECLGAP